MTPIAPVAPHLPQAQRGPWLVAGLLTLVALLLLVGLGVGSTGLDSAWALLHDPVAAQILWDIRLPRGLGAALAGGLLGMAGAVAQGLFRNPLADPYLLGSASGASLGVALALLAMGGAPAAASLWLQLGLTGSAFAGATAAVLLTLALAQGVHSSLRLLLSGVVVGVVLGAMVSLAMVLAPSLMQSMQAFMLGSTGYVGWSACALMGLALLPCLALAWVLGPTLDGLVLGESTARSLGLPLAQSRVALVLVLAMATGAAVAHTGLIAFVGLVAPHLVRSALKARHRTLIVLSTLSGAALLQLADLLARGLLAPQELPVGVLTAVLGGGYLLWLMRRAEVRL